MKETRIFRTYLPDMKVGDLTIANGIGKAEDDISLWYQRVRRDGDSVKVEAEFNGVGC